jgi:hypothetical protein
MEGLSEMGTTKKQRILEHVPEGYRFLAMLAVSIGFGVLVAVAVDDLYPSGGDGPFYLATAAAMGLFSVLATIGAIGGRILAALTELVDSGESPGNSSA